MTISEPSTRALRDAIAALEPRPWLRKYIIEALDDANKAVSIVSFYQRYFNRLIPAFDDPDDAELVDFLSSRMRESEEVVNAHVENQRDHLRHTIHDFLLGYLFLNATSYFHPIAEAYARRVGYRGEPMSCLNYAYFLAAHFHDLGYPVEFHRYLLEFARKITSDFPHVSHMERGSPMKYGSDAPLTSLFAWRAGLYGVTADGEGNIPTLPAHAVRSQVDRPDHALTAAFLLWDRATEHESEPLPGKCFTAPVLRTAALACASHNFQYLVDNSIWYRISLTRDPVSFLLQLVDEVQDWSRERIDVDLLWDIGREVAKHRHSRAILCETPSVALNESGRLDISYAVAVQPFLDDQEDPYQLARARELLERKLIERNRYLAGVLKMDGKSSISLEGRYLVGRDSYPSGLYKECVVRVAVGQRRVRWEVPFQPVPSRIMPGLERACAVEVMGRQSGARVLIDPDDKLKLQGCTLGETQIVLDPNGKVTITGLQGGTVIGFSRHFPFVRGRVPDDGEVETNEAVKALLAA